MGRRDRQRQQARRHPCVPDPYTQGDRLRQDKLQAHALEATEQCGGTFVPEVTELTKLATLLDNWPSDRKILFCDEARVGQPVDLPKDKAPWAILIGPEGGFPRILRADTAAVAALTLWQEHLGDWP